MRDLYIKIIQDMFSEEMSMDGVNKVNALTVDGRQLLRNRRLLEQIMHLEEELTRRSRDGIPKEECDELRRRLVSLNNKFFHAPGEEGATHEDMFDAMLEIIAKSGISLTSDGYICDDSRPLWSALSLSDKTAAALSNVSKYHPHNARPRRNSLPDLNDPMSFSIPRRQEGEEQDAAIANDRGPSAPLSASTPRGYRSRVRRESPPTTHATSSRQQYAKGPVRPPFPDEDEKSEYGPGLQPRAAAANREDDGGRGLSASRSAEPYSQLQQALFESEQDARASEENAIRKAKRQSTMDEHRRLQQRRHELPPFQPEADPIGHNEWVPNPGDQEEFPKDEFIEDEDADK